MNSTESLLALPLSRPDIEIDFGFLLDPCDEYEAVLPFDGQVALYGKDEEGGRDEETRAIIGHVSGHLINASGSASFLEADSMSGDLINAIAAVTGPEGINEELSEDGVWLTHVVLNIGHVELEPEYRGRGIGLWAVHAILTKFRAFCVLAVLQPACLKLAKHWSRLGFKPTSYDKDVYYLDLTAYGLEGSAGCW